LVAIVLIAPIVANVAALCLVAAASAAGARRQTSTSILAMQKMEQLLSLIWITAGDPPGVPISDLDTDTSVDPPSGGGPGLSTSPAGALDRNTPGYVDYLDAAGASLGGGSAPPAAAVYVRRWSIDPLPSDPDNVLILQVFVTSVDGSRRTSGGKHVRQPGDALLVDVKTRMAQ